MVIDVEHILLNAPAALQQGRELHCGSLQMQDSKHAFTETGRKIKFSGFSHFGLFL